MDSTRPLDPPSPLFTRELPRIRATRDLGPVLDVACGRGRHIRALSAAGVPVVGIDRNAGFLHELRAALPSTPRVDLIQHDLESGHGLPVRAEPFGAILVFRYLHRPLLAALADGLARGGLLLYETFTVDQRQFGTGPSRDAFLLARGELATLFPTLETIEVFEGIRDDNGPAAISSLVARRAD